MGSCLPAVAVDLLVFLEFELEAIFQVAVGSPNGLSRGLASSSDV